MINVCISKVCYSMSISQFRCKIPKDPEANKSFIWSTSLVKDDYNFYNLSTKISAKTKIKPNKQL